MLEDRRDLTTDLGLVLVAAIWGVNFSVVKVVLDHLDPLALNALRFPMAAVALAVVVRAVPGPLLPAREDWIPVLGLGVVGNLAYQLAFIFGLDWTLAGNASLLLATTPVWTMVLSVLAKHERFTTGGVLGVVGTLGGIGLVVLGRGDELSLASETLRGDLTILGAAVLWAAYTVAGIGPVARYGSLRTTAWALWVATPILVLMGVPSLMETDLAALSAGTWAGVVYAGVFSIAVAYLLWYRGVGRLGNSRTAIYANLVPVTALITAWLWLGETPTPLQILGAAVILGGLSLARLTQSPGPSSTPSVPEESRPARCRISGNS